MIQAIPVVTAHEMSRIEAMAYAQGASEIDFIQNAAKAIADVTESFIVDNQLPKEVTLLVGKGNNGGDAYGAARHLLQKGYRVNAYSIYSLEHLSPLCRHMYELFKKSGGKTHFPHSEHPFTFQPQGVILDGLVGTGFHGQAEGMLAQAIVAANESELPIIAIDIPSGVNGDTGAVQTVAIHADLTIYLGLPKLGFFIGEGWNYVGKLAFASFGLKEEYMAKAKVQAHLVDLKTAATLLPTMHRTRHKYEAGYVLGVAGSIAMPGAALLASYAALRSGAGIVRLFHPHGMEAQLANAPYELIREGWDEKDKSRILEESKRAKAVFLGPGMGRNKQTQKAVKSLLATLSIPCVIDADALYFLAESRTLPEHSILTPHHAEMLELLGHKKKKGSQLTLLSDCQEFATKRKVILVLKGAPTFVFHPDHEPFILTAGDPGMATAGAGDVLTGMIAAFLAQGMRSLEATLLAVALHGRSGEIAAENLTSYCLTASDLINYLPKAFFSTIHHVAQKLAT